MKQQSKKVYVYLDTPGDWCFNRDEMAATAGRPSTAVHRFDSMMEFERWQLLLLLVRTGKIKDLKPHPRYVLSESQKVTYTADFRYLERHPDGGWTQVVEDVKGYNAKTGKLVIFPAAKIKHKWFQDKWPTIDFRLVRGN